ncbi:MULTISPECIES: ATP-binding cassette domain-containing protein [unclassified Luteococcus]|uniref:ATP-binding cassette domain-containing protein n=1 Tax=unclassified Luteococcus TaxID=2639923 RepID=UPI00313B8708
MRQSLSVESSSPILAEGITKSFGTVRALAGLDLTVHRGEVHGFLGPNGAGKSTTIRAILGQLRLDAGSLRLFGEDPWRHGPRLHERMAYVPGDTALWPSLSGGECIDLIGRLQGSQDTRRRDDLIQRFELDPRRKAGTYSKGNRQKVALVAALSTRADLLLLDEPTSGLDPVMEERFIETVRELADEGRTVLLSSHIMAEVERLCDRVTIIRAGQTVITDTLDALRAGAMVRVEAGLATPLPHHLDLPGTTERQTSHDGHHVRLTVHPDGVLEVVRTLTDLAPTTLTVTPASLDELFWQHYGKEEK